MSQIQVIQPQLTKVESEWLDEEMNKVLDYLRDRDDLGWKQETISFVYCKLNDLGYAPESIYKIMRGRIEGDRIEISDSYLRKCIRKKSGVRRFPRMAYYDFTSYLDFQTVRQRYIEYVESGQHFIDHTPKGVTNRFMSEIVGRMIP